MKLQRFLDYFPSRPNGMCVWKWCLKERFHKEKNLSKGQLKIMKEVSQGEVLSLQPPTERGTSDTKNRPLT